MALDLPNQLDATHKYVFRSGEYGTCFRYWFIDNAENYYLYSNAPDGHPDHEPFGGEPILDPSQPFLHNAPQFFSPEGLKRNMGAPEGVNVLSNPVYDPSSTRTSWYEYYLSDAGDLRYLYLDKDVKENIDLYVQHNIRVTDAGLGKFRKFAAQLFQSTGERDKTIATILMLSDQAWFLPKDLISAKVGDMSFIDETVYLLGRKLRVDVALFDYLTTLVAGRDLAAPLFAQNTLHGSELPFGERTICATFAFTRVSPVFLQYWHATHIFSKIVNKLNFLKVPFPEVEDRAYLELSNTLNTSKDVRFLVDSQVAETLLRKYEAQPEAVTKSFNLEASDNFGVAQVFSDLIERRGDELSFSQWLHSQPLHSEYEGDGAEEEQELMETAQEDKELTEAENVVQNEDGEGELDAGIQNGVNEEGQTEGDEPVVEDGLG